MARALLNVLGAAILLAGCGPADEASPDDPVDIPSCASIGVFGNGASCDAGEGKVDLTACGADEAACSPGRLCFGGAAILACTCATDADCAGHVAYVNGARKAAGQAPLDPRCDAGRCMGDIDPP